MVPTEPNYSVMARRHRSQSFSELVGQGTFVQSMRLLFAKKDFPQAILFTGTRGVGKTSSARILAKSLCCEQGPTFDPCQKCSHCLAITQCNHEDVIEMDGASHNGVENVRELRENSLFSPISARYKVFIIDEVHMLSIGAFNALLKTLEEPPQRVIFVLATTDLHKVPITIKSRCVVYALKHVAVEELFQYLSHLCKKEGLQIEESALRLIAKEGKGSVRDALSLLEMVRSEGLREPLDLGKVQSLLGFTESSYSQDLLKSILRGDVAQALSVLDQSLLANGDAAKLLEKCAKFIKDLMLLKSLGSNTDLNLLETSEPSFLEFLREQSSLLENAVLLELFRCLASGVRETQRSTLPRDYAEMVLMDCFSRQTWLSAPQTPSKGAVPVDAVPVEATSGVVKDPSAAPRSVLPPSSSRPTAPSPNQNRDFILFGNVLDLLEKDSLSLASKLRHAILEQCDSKKLCFSSVPENRLYAQLNSAEVMKLKGAFASLGHPHVEILGLVPFPGQDGNESKRNAAKSPASTVPKPDLQLLDRFPEKKKINPTESQSTVQSPSSVHQHKTGEADKLKNEKIQKILERPEVKKMLPLLKNFEFIPLDD